MYLRILSFKIKLIFWISIFIMLSLSSVVNAQKKKVISPEFFGRTIDVLYLDDVEHMCSDSPLSEFKDYRNIFGYRPFTGVVVDPEAPLDIDKNYRVKWLVRDKKLFLCDVEILGRTETSPDKYRIIEELTKRKFTPYDGYPKGILFASWFTGSITIKRLPHLQAGETHCDCVYRHEKPQRLDFLNGELILLEECSLWSELFVDYFELYQNRDKYLHVEDPIVPSVRRSPCEILLRKQLGLRKDEVLLEHFFTGTLDEILWDGIRFRCSKSPLSVLEGYAEIYPDLEPCAELSRRSIKIDKPYLTKWAIVDSMLYLYDIDLYCLFNRTDDPLYKKYNPVRLQMMEEFTGKRFRPIPSFDEKGIPATWFSGIIFMKRDADQNENEDSYRCESNHKITFKKGKIVATERTPYVIYSLDNGVNNFSRIPRF